MSWKKATLADMLGDNIVYRNLEPLHPALPSRRHIWAEAGLDHDYVPRKTAPEYANVLVHYLRLAQAARGVGAPIARLLFLGDTLMLDGGAARNVGKHLPLLGFIGAERAQQPASVEWQGELMVANRWGALADFVRGVKESGFAADEQMALLIDVDKTSIGARGRNDKPIDIARVQAIYHTMRATLGEAFNEAAFRAIYDAINQPAWHYFTADNQDYVAYVCLMVIGGICPAEELWRDLKDKTLATIEQFVACCEARRGQMPAGLLAAHDEVRQGIAAEDPTPFKAFRRREYLETISRMDAHPADADAATVLASEITITAEVASVARFLAQQGVLVFGLSDKPDEASLPTSEQAAQGYRPLHRTTMKVHGDELF
jgi:hypothetical protein